MTYRVTRMFCEHQTFANLVRSQRVKFSADLAHHKGFSHAKYSSNTV